MIDNVEQFGYALWLARLDELREQLDKEILPFPNVRQKLGRNFTLRREIIARFLKKLWELGYIEYVRCHGIKLTERSDTLLRHLHTLDKQH